MGSGVFESGFRGDGVAEGVTVVVGCDGDGGGEDAVGGVLFWQVARERNKLESVGDFRSTREEVL